MLFYYPTPPAPPPFLNKLWVGQPYLARDPPFLLSGPQCFSFLALPSRSETQPTLYATREQRRALHFLSSARTLPPLGLAGARALAPRPGRPRRGRRPRARARSGRLGPASRVPALSTLGGQHVFAGLGTWIYPDYLHLMLLLQLSPLSTPALKEASDLQSASLGWVIHSCIFKKKCFWRITGRDLLFSLKKIEWGVRGRLK